MVSPKGVAEEEEEEMEVSKEVGRNIRKPSEGKGQVGKEDAVREKQGMKLMK